MSDEMDFVERPPEAGPCLAPSRVLASDRVLSAWDEGYARTLARVRAASESRAEFVPLAVQMRELRKELKEARRENRKLKQRLEEESGPVRKGQWKFNRGFRRWDGK